MAWGIVAGVGASVVGASMQADSAESAANSQRDAARASDATQRYFYDTTRADNAGFRNTGNAANNRLAQIMGLSSGGMSGQGAPQQTRDQIRAGLASQYTSAGSAATPTYNPNSNYETGVGYANGMQIPTGFTQATPGTVDQAGLNSATDAAYGSQQQASQAQANDPAYGSLSRNYGASDLASDPVTNAAHGYMQPMHQFGQADLGSDLVYQNGLQFGLDEGAKGINRIASASGGSLSGATLKALTRFGNDYGTTKTAGAYDRFTNNQNTQYGQRVDSFNRFNNNQDRTYNKLAGLSGAGMQATNQVSAAGQNAGNNISASQQNLGNAQGAAAIAQGNAYQGAINGGMAAIRGSGYTNAMTPLFNNGYQNGTGSAYAGTVDNGMFTPNRMGM